MRIIAPAQSLHEVVYFIGTISRLPYAPHQVFIAPSAIAGRDDFTQINDLAKLCPWVSSITRGLPADLKFDLDMRPYQNLQKGKSIPLMMAHFCGLEDALEPWLRLEQPTQPPTVVIARSARQQSSLFPWKETLSRIKEYAQVVFCGTFDEYKDFSPNIPEGVRVEWVLSESLPSIVTLLSTASLFIGNQGVVQAIAEGLDITSIIEVAPTNPDNINIRPKAYHSFSGRVLIPPFGSFSGGVIEASPIFVEVPESILHPPKSGWVYPRGLKDVHFDDLFWAVLKVSNFMGVSSKSPLVRYAIIAYTASKNPEWATRNLHGKLFARVITALENAGDTRPLSEYFSPLNLEQVTLCRS